jgi:hypothetical protein
VGQATSLAKIDDWEDRKMAIEISPIETDHVLVWVSKNAPEASRIEGFGFLLDELIHLFPGQGTASKVFWFENAYIELIWVDDIAEATQAGQKMSVDLLARNNWRQSDASPFGIGLRRCVGNKGKIPFATKNYNEAWMEPGTEILMAKSSSELTEPMFFVVPEYMAYPGNKAIHHPLGVKKMTNIQITLNNITSLTSTSSNLQGYGIANFMMDSTPLLEITFDEGIQGKSCDIRPEIPLLIHY